MGTLSLFAPGCICCCRRFVLGEWLRCRTTYIESVGQPCSRGCRFDCSVFFMPLFCFLGRCWGSTVHDVEMRSWAYLAFIRQDLCLKMNLFNDAGFSYPINIGVVIWQRCLTSCRGRSAFVLSFGGVRDKIYWYSLAMLRRFWVPVVAPHSQPGFRSSDWRSGPRTRFLPEKDQGPEGTSIPVSRLLVCPRGCLVIKLFLR